MSVQRTNMTRILSLIICFCFLQVNDISAKGKNRVPVMISFHLEATDVQNKALSIEANTPMGKKFIQKSPAFVTSNFTAYYPFVSPHEGELYGVSLQLDPKSARRLQSLSAQHKGQYIVANVNGKVVDMILIDKQVDGRVITIWRGIDPAILKLVNPILPQIGEDPKVWKERIKKEAKEEKRAAKFKNQ